jgi:hypothetical protein
MSPARIYVIVTNGINEETYFYRNRKDVLEFLIDYLKRPELKITSVDNYIQNKNTLPPSIKSFESFDLYEFLSDEFKIMYGNTFDNKSAKTIQRRYFQLFDDTISSKTDVFI